MRHLLIGLVAVVVVSSVELAYGSTVIDDFNDNATNTNLWAVRNWGTGVTIEETNQRVEVSFAANAQSPDFGAGYFSPLEVQGDFDFQVDYHLLDWPNSNGVRVGLHVRQSDSYTQVERISREGGAETYFVHPAGMGLMGIVETNDESGKLRLARAGDQITGYYYGVEEWVPIATFTATTENMNFGLAAWSHNYAFSDQVVTVAFDNFSASGIAPEPIPEPSTLIIWSLLGALGIMVGWWRKRS